MKSLKYLTIILAVFMTSISVANAEKGKGKKTVYVFGVATSFNDSTAYVTAVQKLDSVELASKTGLLAHKNEYSYQLKDYMARQGQSHSTCVTVNASSLKQLEKINAKMRLKFAKKDKLIVKDIPESEFHYERVVVAQ